MIFRVLKGLEEHVSVDVVHPFMGDMGWSFRTDFDGATGDRVLRQVIPARGLPPGEPTASTRAPVPVLWDKQTGRIVSNEAAEIIRMFNAAFDHLTGNHRDFYPADLAAEVDRINDRVYSGLNNGVYRAGFARTQEAYDEAAADVFATLDWLEARLSRGRYLLGDRLTEADWRLATTLFRFDIVYHGHVKCNRRKLIEYPNLWAYARERYQHPGGAGTVHLNHIAYHYHTSHESISPRRIIPVGPDLDWTEPHGRARLSAA